MKVLCGSCKNKMKVPGSAHIACAWRRGSKSHVWFYEGFDPAYPVPIIKCPGYQAGEPNEWTEEVYGEQKG